MVYPFSNVIWKSIHCYSIQLIFHTGVFNHGNRATGLLDAKQGAPGHGAAGYQAEGDNGP